MVKITEKENAKPRRKMGRPSKPRHSGTQTEKRGLNEVIGKNSPIFSSHQNTFVLERITIGLEV